MIVGVDETGDFDPNSKLYNYFVAALIDQNQDFYDTKKRQFEEWESTVPPENRDKKGEAKGQLLTDDLLASFCNQVIETRPRVLFCVVRIIPNETPKEVLDKHQAIEVNAISEAHEKYKSQAYGNWAEWYGRILLWYKNRGYAHLLKLKCLQSLVGMAFNYGMPWAQLRYKLDNGDDTNIKKFSFKIDKDFIKADNVKTIWNELLRVFWEDYSFTNRLPLVGFWKPGENPVEIEYGAENGKLRLQKIFFDRTYFINSEDHFEVRIADILGTILHRYENRGRGKETYDKIVKHLGGKRRNWSQLVLNREIMD